MNLSEKEKQIREWNEKFVLGVGLPEFDAVFTDGDGAIIKDINGKEYLDFGAQTFNIFVGHKCKRVIDAAIEQMNKLSFCTMLAMNEPKSKFAKLIYDITDISLKKVYTVSGGSEANESAIKLARRARSKVGGYKIMSYLGAYHGATYGAVSLTGLADCKPVTAGPDIPGSIHVGMPYCYRCAWGHTYPNCDIECAKNVENYFIQEGPEHYAAIIMEPVISAKGCIVSPKEYIKRIRDITKKYGVILIFDEVVDGFGRTGKMFAYEHYDVVPDILTLAKGISSGYAAFAAMVVNEELGSLGYQPYYHGFTMSGYPLANAVAYANVNVIIEDKLVNNSAEIGKYFLEKLNAMKEEFEIIGDARGLGLLLSLEIVENKENKIPNREKAKEIWEKCTDEGLLLHMSARGDTVNLEFSPPLIITKDQVDQAVSILRKTFKSI